MDDKATFSCLKTGMDYDTHLLSTAAFPQFGSTCAAATVALSYSSMLTHSMQLSVQLSAALRVEG